MHLFFDTETTGKADFRAEPDAPHQPRLVQLGALLTDDAGVELSSLNIIIKPDGYLIPEEASAIHGFTTEIATDRGINLSAALPVFSEIARKCHVVVAHNIDFDSLIMEGEFLRAGFEDGPWEEDQRLFCTMKAATDICKMPGRYGFKWPKLQEAHKFAFGEEFSGAHDAMADVRACARVYFWLKNLK